ncbi:MAG TPA: gliding motility-associated C-terminal domain-containing protein [Saprospiraceae bacterium]|nr:gliding motility-associated C-terminal domain-containing protein [Saprospiraceae bacterium]
MENLTFGIKRVLKWFIALSVGFTCQIALASTSGPIIAYHSPITTGQDSVTYTFNCIDGRPGDTICIPVTVENFTAIVITQFEIIWNSDVLDFIEIKNPGMPSINVSADFNLSGPNALKFLPFGFNPFVGENLPDGAVLFEVCFRIIGVPGSSSNVGISPYFEFEAVDPSGEIPADSVNCSMTVMNAVNLVGFLNSCGPAVVGGNGAIDVTVYGGSGPYNITWKETISGVMGGPVGIATEGGSMIINVPEGNYDVTITDAGGNSVTYNINVSSLALSTTVRVKHPTCYKFDNGTMWIKPGGGTAPFSYIWESITNPNLAGSGFIRDAGDSSLVTSLPDGTYRILMKDDNGCEVENIVVLNNNPFVFTVNQLLDATCQGSGDGLIDLSISGATPDAGGNYTVIIPNGQISTNSISIGLLNPGTYSITVQDEVSQCDTVFTFTIGSTTTISATVTPTNPLCAGGDGSVSVRGLTNGVPGPTYTYSIFNSQNVLVTNATDIGGIFNYAPLDAGDYTVIVEEGACLSDTIHFTITDPLPIMVSVGGTTIDDCLPVRATGSVWFDILNGTGSYILNAGSGVQDGDTIRNLNAGNYTVTVTDVNGCTAIRNFTIKDGDDNEEADLTFVINGIPCEGGTVTLLYQGGAIPATGSVTWNNTFMGQTIEILEPDTFYADLFIQNIHCVLNDTVIIKCDEELELDITVINPSCNNEAIGGPFTGTVIVDTVNAVGPVTWIWSFPDTTQTGTYSGLSPGVYYVTVTDALDSVAIDSFEIVAPDAIHYSFGTTDSTSCSGVCDGSVMVTPVDGDNSMDYFLYWTNTVPFGDTGTSFLVQDLCAGITQFSVSQDGICFYPGEIEIFSPEPIKIDLVSSTDASCFGYTDGSIVVTASGGSPGYTYDWVGGPFTPDITSIGAGEYFVTAMDSKNCMATDSFSISQPDTLIAQIDSSATLNLSCGASSDGIVTVDVSGGNIGAYTFQWNPNVSSIYQAINLGPGQYFVTVTDIKGCSDTTSYNLTSPPPIIVDWPVVSPPECFGDETVLQIDNVSGGNGNYSFTINGGELLDIGIPIMIPSGIYIVSVFDDRGCSSDTTYIIMEPNPILVSIGPDNPIIDLGDSLFLIGNVDQSDNAIIMTQWTGALPVSCPTCEGTWVYNFVPTLYTWTVTDVNGCQGSTSIMVGVDFDRDIYIPDVFSPNFDGLNDEFSIYTGLGVEKVNFLHIYDRWGNLVYSITDQLPNGSGVGSWDGTNDGEPLNPGVYVYVAEIQFIDNQTKLFYKGDVTLIK